MHGQTKSDQGPWRPGCEWWFRDNTQDDTHWTDTTRHTCRYSRHTCRYYQWLVSLSVSCTLMVPIEIENEFPTECDYAVYHMYLKLEQAIVYGIESSSTFYVITRWHVQLHVYCTARYYVCQPLNQCHTRLNWVQLLHGWFQQHLYEAIEHLNY